MWHVQVFSSILWKDDIHISFWFCAALVCVIRLLSPFFFSSLSLLDSATQITVFMNSCMLAQCSSYIDCILYCRAIAIRYAMMVQVFITMPDELVEIVWINTVPIYIHIALSVMTLNLWVESSCNGYQEHQDSPLTNNNT